MNILFLIGAAIFLGISAAKLSQKLKIPQVVGYIIIGVIIGKSGLGILDPAHLESLTPLISLTLGVIGFLIGAELKTEVFRKYGKSIYFILLAEAVLTFILVFAAVAFITKKIYLGLLLGAIASATDPASTVNVLWEYKSRGPLTTTLTSIVALDDGVALILYGLVSVFSRSMITHQHYSILSSIGMPLLELVKCLGLGAGMGIIMAKIIPRFKSEMILSLVLGGVAVIVGVAVYFNLDLILTTMTMGAVIANLIPKISEKVFKNVTQLTMPLYVFFFVFVGAALDIHVFLQVSVITIVIAYLLSRSAGKIFGAMFGALISGAKKTVTRYAGMCLFTQGGVAIGLAMSIAHNLGGFGAESNHAGIIIINVVAATTFVAQLIGPVFVKLGISKADEVNRNVTKDDIIESQKVSDIMQKEFSVIRENATLATVMQAVKEQEAYHFPVVNNQENLVGVLSLGALRNTFAEEQLNPIVLAKDIALPVGRVLYKDQPLKEAFEIFDAREIDYLPVVENRDSRKIAGILEYQPLVKEIDKKLLERQQSLEKEDIAC